MVFDGARAFEGVTPDLDLHCARVNNSARPFLLKPVVPLKAWLELAADGLKRFDPAAELYIRPMYWAEAGSTRAYDTTRKRQAGACASMMRRCQAARQRDHAIAVPASDRRMCAGRRQGRLPLPQ